MTDNTLSTEEYVTHIIIIKIKVLLPQVWLTLTDFNYPVLGSLVFLLPKTSRLLFFSTIFALSVPNEGFSRNASFLLLHSYVCCIPPWLVRLEQLL